MRNRILNLLIVLTLLGVVGCSRESSVISDLESGAESSLTKNSTIVSVPATSEVAPWGVARIGGGATATDKTAWIIDSGIELNHPDLNVDIARSISFVKDTPSPADEFGHGTHVAGIIGAIKGNGIGVVGVAAGAKVVSVRVMDKNGNGSIAAMVAGIEYVSANARPGDVVSISFEVANSADIDKAVMAASKKGIIFVIAAGNNSSIVCCSPAHLNGPNIYTVSAMDKNDQFATFSNFGSSIVDYAAPGVEIFSTAIGGGYSKMSGTSMAAPHLAGLLLIGSLNPVGNVLNDPDGIGEPIAHH